MTRSDLIEKLAARFSQLTHRDSEFAVTAILEAMNDALVRGHRIEIRGFGSFSIIVRPPRIGRNPRSGESVAVPEKRVPHFKPGKAMRVDVDKRSAEIKLQVGTLEVKAPNEINRKAMADLRPEREDAWPAVERIANLHTEI